MQEGDEDEPVFDDDNPEWTEEDFAKALPYDQLPEEIKRAFKRADPARQALLDGKAVQEDDEGLTPNKRGYK
jgi:hypothetical protein